MCEFPTCNRHPEENGWCIVHQMHSGKPRQKPRYFTEKKVQLSHDPVGVVRVKEIIDKRSVDYLKNNPVCAVKTPWCTEKATMIDHGDKAFKMRDLLDQAQWTPSCKECNNFLINNPHWGKPAPEGQ